MEQLYKKKKKRQQLNNEKLEFFVLEELKNIYSNLYQILKKFSEAIKTRIIKNFVTCNLKPKLK